MYNYNLVKEQLSEKIKFINETVNELVFRCPYCGDSDNPRHGHLYISKENPVFHCKRCNAGMGKTLNDLFVYVGLEPISELKTNSRKIVVGSAALSHDEDMILREFRHNETIIKWLGYIKYRLSLHSTDFNGNFQYMSLLDPKLISNLTFDNIRSIQLVESFRNIMFSGQLVPFLTYRRSIINGRVTGKNEYGFQRRYYTLVLNSDNSRNDLYVVTDKENLDYDNIDTVIISEGVFDSLGLFFYLKDEYDLSRTLWVSALSNSYIRALNFVNSEFKIKEHSLKVMVFMDNDADLDQNLSRFKQIFTKHEYENLLRDEVEIYKNMIGKDYGTARIKLHLIERFI